MDPAAESLILLGRDHQTRINIAIRLVIDNVSLCLFVLFIHNRCRSEFGVMLRLGHFGLVNAMSLMKRRSDKERWEWREDPLYAFCQF